VDSWDLIFKPEYMSKLKSCGVAVLDNGPELLPIALHYLGLPPQPRPRGLREGQGAADEVRPYISYFHSSKYTGDLANGDICVVVGFSAMCCRRRTAPKRRRTA
jgi:putrescine transport system substrate-binding protein